MSAQQAVILVLLVAAFAAGWFAGGGRGKEGLPQGEEEDDVAPVESPALEGPPADEPEVGFVEPPLAEERATPPRDPGEPVLPPGWPGAARDDAAPAAPLPATARALDLAVGALEVAVDRWLDEGTEISPAGRAAVGELDRAVARLDAAVARLSEAEPGTPALRVAGGALDALREAADLVTGFREGRLLDADTSRELSGLEDEIDDARERLRAAAAAAAD